MWIRNLITLIGLKIYADMKSLDIMVSVQCLVYNHKPYLRQCLNGIVMQKTNFRFEAIVHDDASTDGCTTIIKEFEKKYPDIIKPIYQKENQYSHNPGLIVDVVDNKCCGKYIAICEGDDYWVDPFKLQKQVDFLESHSEYGLVYTAFREDWNGVLSDIKKYDFGDNSLLEYLSHKGGIIATASTMSRASLYLKREINLKLPMGDVPVWIQLMHVSKAKFLDDVTTVYRILGESASHSQNLRKKMMFGKSALQVRRYYAEKYGFSDIAESLYKRERKFEILIYLYDLHVLKFISAFPWKYDVSLRNILGVLKKKTLASLNMC